MFRRINNDKIGNIINYLSSEIEVLSMTKTLKLLYIIDETSIRETGIPITWLDYKVWENGPVAIDIYNEIKHKETFTYQGKELSLDSYIALNVKYNKNREEIYLKPKSEFKKGIFSKYEIGLLERIVFMYGNWTSKELIELLHEENTLWHKKVKKHNLKHHFKSISRITNYSIEFSELIEGNSILELANKASFEALQFQIELNDYEY